ncbi:MAG TPA: hypothetical protein ENI38_03320, partial [Candidatus Acetothermia bacterium]|nr:hypothetical protein [Candidatus Acetothermia bacterium]
NTVTGNGLESGTGWWAENGIQIGYGATGEIVGNTVTDCRVNSPSWAASAILVVDTNHVVVADNYVANSDIGIGVIDFPGAIWGSPWDVDEVEDVEVRGNTLAGNSWGLDIANGVTDILVVYNVFIDNAGDAIDLYDYSYWYPGYAIPAPSGVVIHYNSITGSGGDGLWVMDTVTDLVDATLNWWGSPEGPDVDWDADGTLDYAGGGDSITGTAAFSPWLAVDPDGDPILPGVQITGPILIIVAPVGPEPTGGYLNAAIRGANELPLADTIEVRHGTYDASEPITDAVTIVSEEGSASHTTLTGDMSLGSPGIRIGFIRRGFTILGDITVLPGVDASTVHINWNDLYGIVANEGFRCLDATYNWWAGRNPYDAIVGGGPAGYVAARRLGQLGKETVLVERDLVGGTCLNRGCIPTKALYAATEPLGRKDSFRERGIVLSAAVDLPRLRGWTSEVVATLRQGVEKLLEASGVEVIKGEARLAGPGQLRIATEEGEEVIQARAIVLATGSAPIQLPGLPFDGERVLSSRDALALPKVPEYLVVVGGGVIGLELATVYRRLGSQVTVVGMQGRLLPGIGLSRRGLAVLGQALRRQGIEVRLNTAAVGCTRDGL